MEVWRFYSWKVGFRKSGSKEWPSRATSKMERRWILMELFHHNTTVMSEVRRFGKPQPNKGSAESSNLRRVIAREQLYQTVDGYGLRSFINAVSPSEWLEDGVDRMPTQKFLQCIKVRAAVLHNKLRSARKDPMAKTTCDADCEEVESLDHIVQNCHRTNGPRHARHDAVVRMLENRLKEKGYVTKLEPRIPTVLGIRILNTSFAMWRLSRTHLD